MPRFRYKATDINGNVVSGEVVASSKQKATAELQGRNFRVESVEFAEGPPENLADDTAKDHLAATDRLTGGEVLALADGISHIAKAGLPLAAGLRALSEEAPSHRLRRTLLALSRRLEMGTDLNAAVGSLGRSIPRKFRGIVEAGARTGRLPQVLEEYVIANRQYLDLRHRLWLSLAYPLLLVVFAAGVMAFLFWKLVPDMQLIFVDFGTSLPSLTITLCRLSDFLRRHTKAILAVLAVVCALVPLAPFLLGMHWLGPRIFCAIPLWGSMFRYSSLSQLCRLLAILIENGVNLPEAMRIAAMGVRDADVRHACRRFARRLEQGEPVSEAARASGGLPPMLVVALRPERGPRLVAEALRVMGDIYEARAQTQCQMLGIVVEPMVLIGIVLVGGATVWGLVMPLIKLLNDLS